MRPSACNQLRGKVIATKAGPVNVEVTLALNARERLTTVIARDSFEEVGPAEGREVYALIKAPHVILGVA